MIICGDSSKAEQSLFQTIDGGAIPTSPLQLFIKEINKETAKTAYRNWHYLGKKGFISVVSYGAYFDNWLVGAISFHPPSSEETVKGIFGNTDQVGIWEIGRLAMSDNCPKNSESRFIAISIKLLRRNYTVKAVITYADTSQGHLGTIYKASGFEYMGLTAPKNDFWINGKIQERGKTKGLEGEWKNRPRKHKFIKYF
jgi:hypothetical protein